MADIQDSPSWQSLRGFMLSKYHLIFAVYIDWSNPFSNKIADKIVSCGAIIRFLPENVSVIGMMPAPHSPSVWTISHILISFQRAIAEFDLPGKLIPTYSNPGGTIVALRVIPIIADLQAIRKVTGFLSHAAGLFCSFCYYGATVRAQALQWKNTVTVTAKEILSTQTGVRWTPMHDFPYWDPAKYVVLGFMHNFLEGVLAYQLRNLWGIERTTDMLKKIEKIIKDDESISSVDTEELNHEFQELESEAEEASQHGSATGLTNDFNDMNNKNSGSSTPTHQPIIGLNEDDEADEDYVPENIETAFKFTADQLTCFRNWIHDVLLPASSDQPPINLGEASHGKLKAHELLVLFTAILPLIIPYIWWKDENDPTAQDKLQSFCDLVAATNIISAYSTSSSEADRYMDHFVKYRASIQELYPGFKSVPNHHYAMHGGEQLKFWGPLAMLSEFPGEGLNGDLGKIKTNKHFCEYNPYQ
ncbi:hypothetical protein C8R42DRAFT_698624 [Lentinula raphanica]|nr:hypothetical protein C8R42DRAFT_698624 [Lentinula raphanica]